MAAINYFEVFLCPAFMFDPQAKRQQLKCDIFKALYTGSKIFACKIDFIRYIIAVTLDIFKLICSMCLCHFRSEEIIRPRQ